MLDAAKYRPEPDSLPDRLLRWFLANPDEELSYRDIASKFEVIAAANVLGSIMTAITRQILTRGKDSEGHVVVRTGPAFTEWREAFTAGAPLSALQARTITDSPRPKKRRAVSAPAPDFDPAGVEIHMGVQHRSAEPMWKKFLRLFERMSPESHVRMGAAYKATAGTALTNWRRSHPEQKWSMEVVADEIVVNRLA